MKFLSARRLAVLVGGIGVVACGLASGPDTVARKYLELGAAGDTGAAGELVQRGCDDASIMDVTAIRMMGVPMTIEKLTVTVDEKTADRATVSYTAEGSVDGKSAVTQLLGVEVKVGSVQMDSASKSGTLELVKEGLFWKIACP